MLGKFSPPQAETESEHSLSQQHISMVCLLQLLPELVELSLICVQCIITSFDGRFF